MMKRIMALLGALALSFSINAAEFTEGDYYKVLDLPKSSTPIVNEFFSFYCPHCNSLEPLIQGLKKTLPDDATFEKTHVSFMGGKMGLSMSKAYATMVSLRIEDKMVPILFNQIHSMQKPPRNDQELRQIFIDAGIHADKFDGIYNSFVVHSMVNSFDKAFQDSGLTSVPSVVVNNKYFVETGKIQSTEEYYELIHWLLKK
jgi:thiol:disulfide interchange protein DsbA